MSFWCCFSFFFSFNQLYRFIWICLICFKFISLIHFITRNDQIYQSNIPSIYFCLFLLHLNHMLWSEQGWFVERQSVKKSVEKTHQIVKANGWKKCRKVNSIVCLKVRHIVKRENKHEYVFRPYDSFWGKWSNWLVMPLLTFCHSTN